MPYIPLKGFLPDVDQTTHGIITDCNLITPTHKGFKALPSNADTGIDALADVCVGAAALKELDDSTRLVAGTLAKLYDVSTTTWTDQTRVSGGDYGLAAGDSWSFAQYGSVSLATNKADILQFSITGAFADADSGAPKASIVEVIFNFVMVFDTDEAVFGNSPNRWWCSALGDYTDWTPSISTQSASGIVTDTPGPILAAKRLGETMIIYKKRSMYIGRYLGPPFIWGFVPIPGEVGAPGKNAVVSIDTHHLFIGNEDFYMFDGTRPRAIGYRKVADFFFNDVSDQHIGKTRGVHDRATWTVYWHYPSKNSADGSLDSYIAYNYRSEQWGFGRKDIEVPMEYFTPTVLYDEMGDLYTNYDDLPTTKYNDLFSEGKQQYAVFDTSHVLNTVSGVADPCWYETNDYGDEELIHIVDRIRPRYETTPTTAIQTHKYKDNPDEAAITSGTVNLVDGAFDSILAARFHRFRHDYTGDMEVIGLNIRYAEDSLE